MSSAGIIAASRLRELPIPEQAETTALYNYAAAQGISAPQGIKKEAINRLIFNLKDIGLWQTLDVYLQFAYNDTAFSQFSRICWKRLSLINIINNCPYTINGREGDKISGYVDTLFNASIGTNNYKLNDAHRCAMVYKDGTQAGNLNYIDGTSRNSVGYFRTTSSTPRIVGLINSTQGTETTTEVIDLAGVGMKVISRDASNHYYIANATTVANSDVPSTILYNQNNLLFASNAALNASDVGISSYSLGSQMSITTFQNYRNRYNTYLSKIGLNPIA